MTDTTKPFQPWVPKRDPWLPPDYDERVIHAARAFEQGKASEAQQRIFWRWLIYITEANGMPYRPGRDSANDTAFACGKMFVGQQIMKMLHPELTPADAVHSDKQPKRRTR